MFPRILASLMLISATAPLAEGGHMVEPTSTFDPGASLQSAAAARSLERWKWMEAARSLRHQERIQRLRQVRAFGHQYELLHTLVELDADESTGTIDSVSTVRIRAAIPILQSATFLIQTLNDFQVEDESGRALPVAINSSWGTVEVTLPTPLSVNEETVLRFHNRGRPVCEPDPYFGMTHCQVAPEITFFAGADWAPTRAASTMEDYLEGGRVDFSITTPPGYTAVTTSEPSGVEDLGDRLIHRFTGSHSSAGVIGLAYARFDSFTAMTRDGKPVATRIHTGTREFGQSWADRCADVVNTFSDWFTPYLYPKHDAVQTIEELGGGVGPQALTFYYASAFTTDPAVFSSESIFAHEIAHSWWGGMVRMVDPYSPWLNEGFASFSASSYGYRVWPAYYQDRMYESAFQTFRLMVPANKEVTLSGEGIYNADPLVYMLITYDKGNHVLRMLQWLLGEEKFRAGLSAYAAAHTWDLTHQGVDVAAFRQAMETASGLDLGGFFRQWVFGTGYPIYQYAAQFGDRQGTPIVRLRVEQVQDPMKKFDLPLEVAVWVQDQTEPLLFRIEFEGRRLIDRILELPAAPRGVKLDPASRVWGQKVNELLGDVDSTNEVNGVDLIYTAWCQGGKFNDAKAWNYFFESDFDGDGDIDTLDLDALLANFGRKGEIHD